MSIRANHNEEFHLTTGLPCVVDKDEDEAETSATKKRRRKIHG
ncbi:unnamed protein product [Brassica napus]|uniref:(rape) hypothetical protein n=1 Tax=Brassica napus TaxID=3708 RepID=A0A816PME1_BRANA|nr:unnamed protein product [Brassica napus]